MLRLSFGNIFETFRGQHSAIRVDGSLMGSRCKLHMKSIIENAAGPCHQRDTRFILRTAHADAWSVCHDAVHEAVKPSCSSVKRCIKIQQSNVEWSSSSSLQHADHRLLPHVSRLSSSPWRQTRVSFALITVSSSFPLTEVALSSIHLLEMYFMFSRTKFIHQYHAVVALPWRIDWHLFTYG